MIVVDTSALIAIVTGEVAADRCRQAMLAAPTIVMSAGSFAEAMIVSGARCYDADLLLLVEEMDVEIVPVDELVADQMLTAYRQWGRGFHPARLNFGDCFAYALASERQCPLLYVGEDFAQTDITAA